MSRSFNVPFTEQTTKKCSKCSVEKPFAEFSRQAAGKFGFTAACRECNRAICREYARTHKDQERARASAWAKANPARVNANAARLRALYPDRFRAYSAKWREENPEKSSAMSKAYESKRDKEKRAAQQKAWRARTLETRKQTAALYQKKNPEVFAIITAKRRSQKLCATPSWANNFYIDEAYDISNKRSLATGLKWNVDHIVPLQSKLVCGLHVHNNLQVIPSKTNFSKSNRHWPDMP